MIYKYEFLIKSKSDFENIKNYLHSDYYNDETIKELKSELWTKVDKVIIESNYIDADYLSEYRMLYSGIFKSVSRTTYRLLFFNKEKFVGYITLVPIDSKGHICRMFFDPRMILNKKSFVLCKDYSLHFLGEKISYKSFRAIRQEGCLCVCGHSAVYGINNYASMWKGYTERTVAEISDATIFQDKQRIITPELRPSEIMKLLNSFGFNPIFRSRRCYKNKDDIITEALGYVQSGIPVILVIGKNAHGIVAVGYETFDKININNLILQLDYSPLLYENNSEGKTNSENNSIIIIDANEYINNIIVNDDNKLAFSSLPRVRNKNDGFEKMSQLDISSIIIPLYPKLNMDYGKAKSISLSFATHKMDFIPIGERNKYHHKTIIISRTFLTSGNKLKSYINSIKHMSSSFERLNYLELSKFVWVTEFTTPEYFNDNKITGILVLDSTQTINSDESCIFSIGQEKILLLKRILPDDVIKKLEKDDKSSLYSKYYCDEDIISPSKPLVMPRFDKNLTEIN